MTHRIHSVIVSYNRLELTKQAWESYIEHTTLPFTVLIVDNGSTDGTEEWLHDNVSTAVGDHSESGYRLLGENRYPGYATNIGWQSTIEWTSPKVGQATFLHRADNDFAFLPGWCDEVTAQFDANPRLGQLGLRTDEEEGHNTHNVGGNNVIRRELWDQGLRYDERTWPEISKKVKGYTEDSFLSPRVKYMGWEWGRVSRPCIRSLSVEAPGDPDYDSGYYERTWADRGIG